MNYTFEQSKKLGFDEVILNSGPRYRPTAWKFYTKAIGKPLTIAKDYYGKNRHAVVWRKIL